MAVALTRAALWFLCLAIGLASFRILFLGMEESFPHMSKQFSHAAIFWTHVLGAAAALMLMPFQFWKGLRNRRRALHRWIGRAYVLVVLAGGLSGLYMSFFAATGPVAGAGFFILAVLWLATTWMAYAKARARDFAAHERWMIRSAALTFAAVTLRLYIPLGQVAGLPFDPAYTVIAWACWVPNLIAVEWWLWRRGRADSRSPVGAV
ncbi:DUF2306 domain-containing protein [Tabrizicola sp.]|uniref:DUF2306 domain-containing protein n=1 Tax=Tabrizicola sp. TaxID=2005166 RepID=UPI003F398D1B